MTYMKSKILTILTACMLFLSCGEDRTHESDQYTEVQRWIDGVMREVYYWYGDIPEPEKLNYFSQPPIFFNSLLSSKDGRSGVRFSTIIDKTEVTTRDVSAGMNYGIEYILESHPAARGYVARILCVLPDSPAADKGLKRGDFILSINDQAVTNTNVTLLSGADVPLILSVGSWNDEQENIIERTTVELTNISIVEDNPVYLSAIIQHANKHIGYLVYNHFTPGYSDSDTNYDRQLKEISNQFKSNIDELIIDFRYNGGGLLSSAQLICSLLVPEADLGKPLGHLEFNDKQDPRTLSFNMEKSMIEGGTNLSMNKIYFIVGRHTASASEMVINSLIPYMDVVLIGAQTIGKNVGSHVYTSETYPWELHPIDCKIYNALNTSDYERGFEPDYEINEFALNHINTFLPLGDVNETLLSTTLSIIDGSYQEEVPETRSIVNEPVYSSLDRKYPPAVIIQ